MPIVPNVRRLAPILILFSNVARAGSQWVLLWFFAIVGGPHVVGEYSIALAVSTPIFIVLDMSIRNVFVTLQARVHFLTYLRLRLLTSVIAFSILLVLAYVVATPPGVLLLIGAIKAVDSILELAYGVLQKKSDLLRIAWTSLLNSGLTVAMGVAVFALSNSVELALVGSLAGSVITGVLVLLPILASEQKKPRIKGDSSGLGSVVRAGIPSGLAYASVSLLTYLPVYFLSATETTGAVGIFAVVAYFPVFANLLFASVQQVTLNNFVMSHEQEGERGLRKYSVRIFVPLFIVGLILGALTYVFGGPFIVSVFGPEFAVNQTILLPVAASLGILPVVYVSGAILLTKNRYTTQFIAGALALGVSAIIATLSVDDFDLQTAASLIFAGTASRALFAGLAAIWHLLRSSTSRQSPLSKI